jgi:colanic acid/amylovoran biosynthesis glycosyltransferase
VKKFAIAFVVNYFPSYSETFILNQITDLIDKGQNVKIYSLNSSKLNFTHSAIEKYNLLEKTTYFHRNTKSGFNKAGWFFLFTLRHFRTLYQDLKLRIVNPYALRKAIHSHSLSLSLQDYLNRGKFDIVHVHFGQRGAIIANLMAKGIHCKFKFIVTFHGYDLNPSKIEQYKIDYGNLFLHADAVTVNTIYLKSILLKVWPNPKKLFILPAGLRTDQYRKRPTAGDESNLFTIIYCGRFIELKAPDLAVRIANILVHERGFKNISLRMIGSGELREEVENLIKELGLQEHVALLGALSQESVVEVMNNAQVFLLPGVHERATGRTEAQGLVIQEAQAMELPVVVSDAGGMKYGLVDGVSGFIVKERDLVAFADKIECLMKDEVLRVKMGKAGRDFVVNNFDTKLLGDKLLNIYSTL